MGTLIQALRLSESDYRGERFADHGKDLLGNHDVLCLTRPDVIEELHKRYLRAGADIVETNTFSSTAIGQSEYDLGHVVEELNRAAAEVARRAADGVAADTVAAVVAAADSTTAISAADDERNRAGREVRYSSTTQPSRSWTIRLPYAALASEWVTWMIVVPPSFSFLKSSMISLP